MKWKSYLAGFIDGEGCLNFYTEKGTTHTHFRIMIANTNKTILKRIQEIYGGSIYQLKRKRNYKLSFCLKLDGKNSYKLLDDTFPYLILKREQAKLAYQLKKTKGKVITNRVSLTKNKNIIEGKKVMNWEYNYDVLAERAILSEQMRELNMKGDRNYNYGMQI